MQATSILIAKHDHVATITLNRPSKLNAFDTEMIQSLGEALASFSHEEKTLRCVLLTGSGRGFCAGADLDYLVALRRDNRVEEFHRLLEGGRRVVTFLRQLPVPVIAAVNGPAAGGGASIAMACDIRIASESATFTQAFAKVGVHADFGASFLLPRLVGESKARELLFTAETITAMEAYRIGLVSRVVPAEGLPAAAVSLSKIVASRAALSLKLMKQSLIRYSEEAFREALDRELEAQFECFSSPDFLDRLESFVRKGEAGFEARGASDEDGLG
ncbi:MAG: enoyl-CoA hydratase/isomerase family protein [Acidobacteriia bacterium]|nr:enoyl-CoA hydratase/isomerase family protein [Terriglobia bacterium]